MIGRTNATIGASKETQLVNYTMLYDAGNECEEVTGGFNTYAKSFYADAASDVTEKAPTLVRNISYLTITQTPPSLGQCIGSLSTINSVDMSNYSKLFINTEDSYVGSSSATRFGTYNVELTSDYTSQYTPSVRTNIRHYTSSENSKGWFYVEIPSGEQHLAIALACPSDITSHSANIYHLFMVKDDNWQEWIGKVGYTTDDYATLEDVLADSTALNTLMNNYDAVKYMLQNCTGTVMASVIQSESALDIIRESRYNAMIYKNEHWNKFLRMVGEVPESEKTYLYKSGDECIDLTGGWVKKPLTKVDTSYTDNTNTDYFVVTKNADNINAKLTTHINTGSSCYSNGCIGIANMIDLSGYEKLNIEFALNSTSIAYLDLCVSTGVVSGSLTTAFARSVNGGSVTGNNSLDITSITDSENVYLLFTTTNPNTTLDITLHKVWLE